MKQILDIIISGDSTRFGTAADRAIAAINRINLAGGRMAFGLVSALAYGAKRIVDISSNLVDMSAQLSVGASRLRAFETAAATAGVTLDDIGRAMKEFQKSQAAALRGPGLDRSAFAAFGIGVDELKTLGPGEGLLRLGDAMQKGTKNAMELDAAVSILGKSGQKLAGAMRTGWADAVRDLEKSGLIPTDKDLRKVDDLGDRWVAVVKRIQNQILRMAGPMEEFLGHLAVGSAKAAGAVGTAFVTALRMLGPESGSEIAKDFVSIAKDQRGKMDRWAAEFVKRWDASNADGPAAPEPTPMDSVVGNAPSRASLPTGDALARIGLFRGGTGGGVERRLDTANSKLDMINRQLSQISSELSEE